MVVSAVMHRSVVAKRGQTPCMRFGEDICVELTCLLYVDLAIPDVLISDNKSNNWGIYSRTCMKISMAE